jgi:CDP-diacylglycerol--glycerol-3-phosphate 3-phosphatidyltransferase
LQRELYKNSAISALSAVNPVFSAESLVKSDQVVRAGPLGKLRRRWWAVAFLYAVSLSAGYALLRVTWQPSYAWRWAILAGLGLAYGLWLLGRGLKDNHRQGEAFVLPTLGAGNAVSLLRGLLLGLLAGFLFAPRPPAGLAWAPALLYSLAIAADYLDGYLARVTHHATLLGATLDMEFDALGMLIATALAVGYRQMPVWYLLPGLARYLFVFGMAWRRWRGKPVYPLVHKPGRRMMAGFQMSFTSVLLWPLISPPATTLAGIVFTLPFMAGFTEDWLEVSGRIGPASHRYRAAKRLATVVGTVWLPILLRLVLVAVVLGSAIAGPGSASSPWMGSIFGLAVVAAAVMVAMGAAGRVAALGLLIAACSAILAHGLDVLNGLMLACAIALMLLGSGAYSIWQPEDALLSRRAGEKKEG